MLRITKAQLSPAPMPMGNEIPKPMPMGEIGNEMGMGNEMGNDGVEDLIARYLEQQGVNPSSDAIMNVREEMADVKQQNPSISLKDLIEWSVDKLMGDHMQSNSGSSTPLSGNHFNPPNLTEFNF